MPISRFEDLIAWQKARELVASIYQTTSQGAAIAKDFGLRDQIRRSAVSTMSKIAEGFDRGSRPEFHKFLVIAKGSCAEVRSQLYVALDCGYGDPAKAKEKLGWIPKTTFDELVAEMVREDIKSAERNELVKHHGYKAMDYQE